MRVGIVTGEVAVTVGALHEGMVAGDAVNTAARVQSAATPGQVWVDETTRLLTTSAISYVDVGSHELKGKVDPVPLWAVRAVVASRRWRAAGRRPGGDRWSAATASCGWSRSSSTASRRPPAGAAGGRR